MSLRNQNFYLNTSEKNVMITFLRCDELTQKSYVELTDYFCRAVLEISVKYRNLKQSLSYLIKLSTHRIH